jgi:hypothetical protein
LIDKASLSSFIENSSLVHKIDQAIVKSTAGQIVKERDDVGLSNSINELHYVGLETIANIDFYLHQYEQIIYGFAKAWIRGARLGKVKAGICLFYLCYVMIGQRNSIEQANNYLLEFNIGLDEDRKSDAERIISIYNQVVAKAEKERG